MNINEIKEVLVAGGVKCWVQKKASEADRNGFMAGTTLGQDEPYIQCQKGTSEDAVRKLLSEAPASFENKKTGAFVIRCTDPSAPEPEKKKAPKKESKEEGGVLELLQPAPKKGGKAKPKAKPKSATSETGRKPGTVKKEERELLIAGVIATWMDIGSDAHSHMDEVGEKMTTAVAVELILDADRMMHSHKEAHELLGKLLQDEGWDKISKMVKKEHKQWF